MFGALVEKTMTALLGQKFTKRDSKELFPPDPKLGAVLGLDPHLKISLLFVLRSSVLR